MAALTELAHDQPSKGGVDSVAALGTDVSSRFGGLRPPDGGATPAGSIGKFNL
jgi:hypothetical protein